MTEMELENELLNFRTLYMEESKKTSKLEVNRTRYNELSSLRDKIEREYMKLNESYAAGKKILDEKNGCSIKAIEMKMKVLNDYDIVFDCDSMYKPYSITCKNRIKQLILDKSKKYPVVSIMGNFNRGKSFILTELTRKKFPSGYNVETPWLCGFYPEDNDEYEFLNALMIDTAGFETAANYKNTKVQKINNLIFYYYIKFN